MTLVELLVVITVISIMIATSSWVFRPNMTMGQDGTRLASIIENARNAAIAHNTFVWVGFRNQVDANGIVSGVEVMAVESLTGQSSDLSTSGNIRPLTKAQFIPSATLVAASGLHLSGMDTSSADAVDASASTLSTFTVSSASGPQIFSHVIQFSSQGETLVQTNLAQWIDIGLQPLRGQQNDSAGLQISGVTGEVQIFQP